MIHAATPPLRLLRDVREATKLLLLREITRARHTKLKTLAEALNITIPGVSDYVKLLTDEGLIHKVGGEYRATKDGVAHMHAGFRELREFVDESLGEMAIIDATSALAGEDIGKGDAVGLVMERGVLTAYPRRESGSVGRALRAAKAGEEVPVADLEGMVALEPGAVTVLSLPSTGRGAVPVRALREALEDVGADKLAAADLAGLGACNRLGRTPDFLFAPLPATLEAAERGLDVAVLASRHGASEAVSAIEAANAELEDKIPYRVVSLG